MSDTVRVAPNRNRPLAQRLRVLWNNAVNTQYFATRFSDRSPVWLLGVEYHGAKVASAAAAGAHDGAASSAQDIAGHPAQKAPPDLRDLMCDIFTRFFFTYREGFPQIGESGYTSDVGWGCMIRVGQMLLANTLLTHVFGREFRIRAEDAPGTKHRKILKLFNDDDSRECKFSVHQLLRHAAVDGVKPGCWYGPTIVCRTLCRAINEQIRHPKCYDDLVAYIAPDCLISKEDIDYTMKSLTGKDWCPILVLVPLRLGTVKFNTTYIPSLQRVIASRFCIGVIGGKPKHSLFFIGYQDSDLIGLDPHACRSSDNSDDPKADIGAYHCKSPRKIQFSTIDPSIALGFFCQSRAELEAFYAFTVTEESNNPRQPLYSIV